MKEFIRYLRGNWQEALVFGVSFQLIVSAALSGNLVLTIAVLVGVIILNLVVFSIASRVRPKTPKDFGKSAAFSVKRKGVIFTVGKQSDTIELALSEQKPNYVGFVCTSQTLDMAKHVIDSHEELFEDQNACRKVVDPQNIREIRIATKLLIDWMLKAGLQKGDIVLDVTGGMTTMSMGAYSMAEDLQIDSQYVRSEYNIDNELIEKTQRAVFVSQYLRKTA